MIVRVVTCVLLFWVAFSKSVPTEMQSCGLQNRLGLTVVENSKGNTENTDTEEATEDEELKGLYNDFWAVDDLPKQSAYVSIQKLPDVYLDDHDEPCPISDLMPVERSEITEESRDLNAPEFGQRLPYDDAMQPLNGNYQNYANYMPYPPTYPDQFQSCDDPSLYSDNNTMYPQEPYLETSPGDLNEREVSSGEPRNDLDDSKAIPDETENNKSPGVTKSKPCATTSKPSSTTSKPCSTTSKPSTTSEPVPPTSKPCSTTSKSSNTTSKPCSLTSKMSTTTPKPCKTTSKSTNKGHCTSPHTQKTSSTTVSNTTESTRKDVSTTEKTVSTSECHSLGACDLSLNSDNIMKISSQKKDKKKVES